MRIFSKSPLHISIPLENGEEAKIYFFLDKKGLFHHETLPALIINFPKEDKKISYYYQHGLLYRKSGAAIQFISNESSLATKKQRYYYHEEKKLMKDYSPLGKEVLSDLIKDLSYPDLHPLILHKLINSYRYSFFGPSKVYINKTGATHYYEYYQRLHREDGPALIRYDNEGAVISSIWCLEGKKLE